MKYWRISLNLFIWNTYSISFFVLYLLFQEHLTLLFWLLVSLCYTYYFDSTLTLFWQHFIFFWFEKATQVRKKWKRGFLRKRREEEKLREGREITWKWKKISKGLCILWCCGVLITSLLAKVSVYWIKESKFMKIIISIFTFNFFFISLLPF